MNTFLNHIKIIKKKEKVTQAASKSKKKNTYFIARVALQLKLISIQSCQSIQAETRLNQTMDVLSAPCMFQMQL